jgi:hypothetical protein
VSPEIRNSFTRGAPGDWVRPIRRGNFTTYPPEVGVRR